MSIRSNTKAAKAAIREYVKGVLIDRSDEFTRYVVSDDLAATCKGYVEYLRTILKNDYAIKCDRDRIYHDMDGGGAWEIGTWERALLVGSWLHQDEQTINRYYERGDCDEMFRYLIAREILFLAGR